MRGNRPEDVWLHADGVGSDGCWTWKGGLTAGYGVFAFRCRSVRAHRFAYELVKGKIPTGLVIDHLCRNRACINPAHLEAVSNKTNILRGISTPARNAKKAHCKNGHGLQGDNLYSRPDGSRGCKICIRATSRRHYKPHPVDRSEVIRKGWQTRRAARDHLNTTGEG